MPPTSASAQDISSVASGLAAVLPALNRALDRRLAQDFPHAEPSKNQLALLRLVGDRTGITVREAAEVLLIKPNNVSALVSQLVAEGLLERRQDTADKRVAHLHLTPEALRRVAAIERLVQGYVTEALRTLSDGDVAAIGSVVSALATLPGRITPATD
ncbi:MarR family transcriptional regulator [Streptomyces sp. G-G2]|uniref:MarR family winged helix-turn-helix transcriptional regulator n=1 Tax=Streptomyces sp. G-G2 TaxID=3046201 RepID=UPI0024BB33E3|nr:MarR family transcriptional regulator [Streptomyces sp. G-G2]MDJ0385271.1 MarR family transcriptional regulator [Streptomyces sp. G-G2]